MIDLTDLIKASHLFGNLSDRQLGDVAYRFTPLELAQDELLFSFGDVGETMYIVQSGQVEVFVIDDRQEKVTLNIFYPGTSFGELSLLDGRSRSASAIAVSPTKLLQLKRDDFLELMVRWPGLAQDIIHDVSSKLRFASENIQDLAISLEQLNQQLHERSRLKADFISLLTAENLAPLQQVDTAKNQLDTLLAIANVFNQYPDIEQREALKFAPLIEEVIQQLTPQIDAKSLRLHTILERSLIAYAHAPSIQTAIQNLLAYMVRHAHENSHIVVQSRADEHALYVEIWDTNGDVPLLEGDGLWQKFAHVDNPLQQDVRDLDLDLTMVKYIVVRHGGQVNVQRQPDQGGMLGFFIPIMPD